MKKLLSVIACVALAACGGSGSNDTGSAPKAMGVAADTASFETMLNSVRAANGAGPVSYNARLAQAAQAHADEMLRTGRFSHTGANGSSVGDRATGAGYKWRYIAENIAQGQDNEAEVMAAWTGSPGHHRNNINPRAEHYGFARAGSGSELRWVLVLGAD